jgi:ribosomal protein S18 acetylase RimI-like enzyme
MIVQRKKNLPWRLMPMNEDHARQICEWRYDGPYAIYNWSSWEELCLKHEEFTDPEIRAQQYLSAIDVSETVGTSVGYTIGSIGAANTTNFDSTGSIGAIDRSIGEAGTTGAIVDGVANAASPDRLCGFAQLFPLVGVTRLGLGLRPDLCGRGLGSAFSKLIAQEARTRRPANEIDLEVLVWNTRAIKAYERAGFHIADTYERGTPTGPDIFHCMVYRY